MIYLVDGQKMIRLFTIAVGIFTIIIIFMSIANTNTISNSDRHYQETERVRIAQQEETERVRIEQEEKTNRTQIRFETLKDSINIIVMAGFVIGFLYLVILLLQNYFAVLPTSQQLLPKNPTILPNLVQQCIKSPDYDVVQNGNLCTITKLLTGETQTFEILE